MARHSLECGRFFRLYIKSFDSSEQKKELKKVKKTLKQTKPIEKKKEFNSVGCVVFPPSGESYVFADEDKFVSYVKEELEYHTVTGFRYKVLSKSPSLKERITDLIYNLYGFSREQGFF